MNIGIISLGLIGGSLFKKLCESENEIFAVTRNKTTIEEAKKFGANVSDDYNILKNCDIIFVASPINKTLEVLDALENIVKPECIVLDCASVKEFVMKKKRPYKFIGSHPMAGTEFSGWENSFKELFEGAKWVLTPGKDITNSDIDTAKGIIDLTGAQTIIANAKEHDEAVAMISHMPLLVSQAMMMAAKDNKLAMKLASSGFRDMTRLACSNLEMASDMRVLNKKNINKSVKKLTKCINFLKSAKVFKIFADIKSIRMKMYSSEGKNIFREF